MKRICLCEGEILGDEKSALDANVDNCQQRTMDPLIHTPITSFMMYNSMQASDFNLSDAIYRMY